MFRVILEDLKAGGLLKGNVNDMLNDNLCRTWMPHALGHFLGIDFHDVPNHFFPGYKSRKTPGTFRDLKAGMVGTID